MDPWKTEHGSMENTTWIQLVSFGVIPAHFVIVAIKIPLQRSTSHCTNLFILWSSRHRTMKL